MLSSFAAFRVSLLPISGTYRIVQAAEDSYAAERTDPGVGSPVKRKTEQPGSMPEARAAQARRGEVTPAREQLGFGSHLYGFTNDKNEKRRLACVRHISTVRP